MPCTPSFHCISERTNLRQHHAVSLALQNRSPVPRASIHDALFSPLVPRIAISACLATAASVRAARSPCITVASSSARGSFLTAPSLPRTRSGRNRVAVLDYRPAGSLHYHHRCIFASHFLPPRAREAQAAPSRRRAVITHRRSLFPPAHAPALPQSSRRPSSSTAQYSILHMRHLLPPRPHFVPRAWITNRSQTRRFGANSGWRLF
ncbi:hypothetical protein B0H17DRAFT_1324179 [Mycena rosella]|uniref:Uncharacterized protein n=1 Tax=Mycena rosella TaxID=1033263 RepID=A0AAD7H1X3_MYCRO|nr:hypothetical protein B0H17DRAFT_1324179 [Mycena rosella]